MSDILKIYSRQFVIPSMGTIRLVPDPTDGGIVRIGNQSRVPVGPTGEW